MRVSTCWTSTIDEVRLLMCGSVHAGEALKLASIGMDNHMMYGC